MEGNREGSPDWLREFQTPLQTFTTLSSSSPSSSPSREVPTGSKKKSKVSFEEGEQKSKLESAKKGRQTILLTDSGEDTPRKTPQKSKARKVRKKGNDTDSENEVEEEKSKTTAKKVSAKKNGNKGSVLTSEFETRTDAGEDAKEANGADPSMLKIKKEDQYIIDEGDDKKAEVDIDDAVGAEEDLPEKRTEPRVASRLPLVFAEKVHRSKALLECEGEALDLSGDVGAVGRLVVSKTSTDDCEILLDLKGTIYKTTIVPSHTFCVVNFGQSEAKIEAIMDDFVQLQPHSNVYETETMVEGTLDGFLFDSDDEGDKVTTAAGAQLDQKNETTDIADTKPQKKSDKGLAGTKRKSRPAGKPGKKAVKKPSAKKQKTSKK